MNNPLHCICIISLFSHRMNKNKRRTGNRWLCYPMIFIKSWFKVCTEGLLSRMYTWDLQIVDTLSTSTLLKMPASMLEDEKRCFFSVDLCLYQTQKKRKVRKARKWCVRPGRRGVQQCGKCTQWMRRSNTNMSRYPLQNLTFEPAINEYNTDLES